MQVNLIALGGGTKETLTVECLELLQQMDFIIGAKRLLQELPEGCTENRVAAVNAEEIFLKLQSSNAENCGVIYSGDTGFYSGARMLMPFLKQSKIPVCVYPGISSMQLLSARLQKPWQDWRLVSAHGVSCHAGNEVMQGKDTFFLTGGEITPNVLCRQLQEAGLGSLNVVVAENLSYTDEHIFWGTAAELAEKEFSPLSVMLVEAAPKSAYCGLGLPDDLFIRGNVPMTKREVRVTILSKLAIRPGDVVWDIGAGTGSVSVELSFAAGMGQVFAVECNEEACELIRKNREKFCAWNLNLIEGKAPYVLTGLPVPQAIFIGGTKGEIDAVIRLALEKNPNVRICISAIALETLTAAVESLRENGVEPYVTQISVSKTKAAGDLHLLMAQNSIFLITGGCHE